MRWSNLARSALFSVAICCVAMPEAEAIEIFAPPGLSAHVADGMVIQVRGGRGGVRHGGGGWRRRHEGRRRVSRRRRARRRRRVSRSRRLWLSRRRARRRRRISRRLRSLWLSWWLRLSRNGYGYRGYGYGAAAVGAAAVGAAAVAAHHCWINSYGHRECNYNYY